MENKTEQFTPHELDLMDAFAMAIVTGTPNDITANLETEADYAYRFATAMVIKRREYWDKKSWTNK